MEISPSEKRKQQQPNWKENEFSQNNGKVNEEVEVGVGVGVAHII